MDAVLNMSASVVSPVFIGRHDEMAALDAMLGQVQAGKPTSALVGGEAGDGKARLVRECSARPGRGAWC
jgi:predicted ATPase